MKQQQLTLRIDWGDLDLLGHVNNLAIVGYFQSARVEFASAVGMPVYPGMKFGPIEAATEIQFLKQLHYPGTITVHTVLSAIKNTSVIMEHRIIDDAGNVAAIGKEVIVYFDFVNQCKCPLPESIRKKLSEYLSAGS